MHARPEHACIACIRSAEQWCCKLPAHHAIPHLAPASVKSASPACLLNQVLGHPPALLYLLQVELQQRVGPAGEWQAAAAGDEWRQQATGGRGEQRQHVGSERRQQAAAARGGISSRRAAAAAGGQQNRATGSRPQVAAAASKRHQQASGSSGGKCKGVE